MRGRNPRRRPGASAHDSRDNGTRGRAGRRAFRLTCRAATAQESPAPAPLWCAACCNTGEVDCYCGGDLCVCERYGTTLCPACGGRLAWADAATAGTA